MRKGITSKKEERAIVFTKEIFGMGLLLFSVLSLLCVLTGDAVFYTLGKSVQGFFMGTFGYYTFYVLFGFIVFGLKMVIGRPVFSDDARRVVLRLGTLAYAIMAIIQIATKYSRELNFSQFFSLTYGGGALNLSNATPIGALSSIVVFPICRLASRVGGYIFFSLVIVITMLILLKDPISNMANGRGQTRPQKTSTPKTRQVPASRLRRVTGQAREFDGTRAQNAKGGYENAFAQSAEGVNGAQSTTQKKTVRPAYISGEFGIKTKRDYQRQSAAPEVLMGEFAFRNSNGIARSTNGQSTPNYASMYSPFNGGRRSSLSPEAQHILTPPEFNPADLNDTPMRGQAPNDYNRANPRTPNFDRSAAERTTYSPNGGENNGFEDRGFIPRDRQSARRGGLFDQAINREEPRPETRIPNPMDIPGEQEMPRRMRGDAQTYSSSFNSEAKEIPNVEKAYNPLKNQGGFDATEVARNRGSAFQSSQSEQAQDTAPRFGRPSQDMAYRVSRESQNSLFDDNAQENTQNTELADDRQQGLFGERTNERTPRAERNTFENNAFNGTEEDFTAGERGLGRARMGAREDREEPIRFDRVADQNRFDRAAEQNRFDRAVEPTPPTYKETDGSNGSVYVEAPEQPDIFPSGFTMVSAERSRSAESTRSAPKRDDLGTPQRTNVNASILSTPASQVAEALDDEDDDKEHFSIDQMPINYKYRAPSTELLTDEKIDKAALYDEHNRLRQLAMSVVDNFAMRNVKLTLENIEYGMSTTRFEYSIPTSTQLKFITSAQGDIALWLHANGDIRIIPQLPGTSRIGIEVPNNYKTTVRLRGIIKSQQCKELSKKEISITVGKDVMGKPVFLNLTSMPHLLVAGATGTGKSVFLNAMLLSWLYTYSPEDLRIVIVDPKKLEFVDFLGVPHFLFNKIITEAEEAAALLQYMTEEMDRRYTLFRDARVKKIKEYNELAVQNGQKKLPYLVILIDEFADLMMATPQIEKSMTASIKRLAQLARAAGISLIFATQRPSADVISGAIKTNFPARVCFRTSDYTNSQVVLGENGAEKLLGNGDLLYKVTGSAERAQGALVEADEIRAAVDYIQKHNKCYYDKTCLAKIKKTAQQYSGEAQEQPKGQQMSMDIPEGVKLPPAARDIFYRRAIRVFILFKTASKSILQTKLGIGFNRAAKFIDWMEADGFVSYPMDNKQRQVLIDKAMYEQVFNEPFDDDYTK